MTLLQLHSKIQRLIEDGWLDEEVVVMSNNGNAGRIDIVNVNAVNPPAPIKAFVTILVDDY